jgi:long-chain acyl-CoA synthetase
VHITHILYIPTEKIENVYARCKYLAQNYVYGDSLQNCLVGIVVPDEANIRLYLSKAKPALAKKSIQDICRDPIVKQLIFQEMEKCAADAKLNSYEKVKDIYLEAVLWTPEQENPVLTPTQKLMRPAARKRYQTRIDEMYRRINAMGDSKRQEFLGSKL